MWGVGFRSLSNHLEWTLPVSLLRPCGSDMPYIARSEPHAISGSSGNPTGTILQSPENPAYSSFTVAAGNLPLLISFTHSFCNFFYLNKSCNKREQDPVSAGSRRGTILMNSWLT